MAASPLFEGRTWWAAYVVVLPKRCIVIHRLGNRRQTLQVGGLAPVARRIEIRPNASNRPQPRTFHQRPMVWDRLRAARFTPTPVSLSSGSSMCEVSSRSGCKFNPRAPHVMGDTGARTTDFPWPATYTQCFQELPKGPGWPRRNAPISGKRTFLPVCLSLCIARVHQDLQSDKWMPDVVGCGLTTRVKGLDGPYTLQCRQDCP